MTACRISILLISALALSGCRSERDNSPTIGERYHVLRQCLGGYGDQTAIIRIACTFAVYGGKP